MPDVTIGSEPQRQDPFATASSRRIAEWGRLEADDFYYTDDVELWRQKYPGLIPGPETTGQMVQHMANMSHKLGRRLVGWELTWTYESTYDTEINEHLWNNVLNYFTHPEGKRARREWVGRMKRPPLANWVKDEQAEGFAVPIIRPDNTLCKKLNGHRLAQTGNEDVDRALQDDDKADDQRYPKMSMRERKQAKSRHAKRALISVEVKTEVQERVSTQQRMLNVESKVDELMRRIEGGKRSKE